MGSCSTAPYSLLVAASHGWVSHTPGHLRPQASAMKDGAHMARVTEPAVLTAGLSLSP